MRKLWIVLVIVLIIGVGALVAIFNLDRIVKAKKDFFLAGIEEKTGRQVEFEDIGIAVWGGLGVRVKGVSATDDPVFSQANFLEAEELYLKVAIWPLFKKQLQVKKVILYKPVIRVVRDANGRLNIDSIGREGDGAKPGDTRESSRPSGASYALFVAFADIEEGELIFIDQETGTEHHLGRIDLAVQDVRMDEPFTAKLKASFLPGGGDNGQNLTLEGRVGLEDCEFALGERLRKPAGVPH
jgi:AsmA protein